MDTELKCIWCMEKTKTKPCEHCGSTEVVNPTLPHSCHWSRYTINTVQCKICDKIISYEEYLKCL